MIIGRTIEDLDVRHDPRRSSRTRRSRASTTSRSTPACCSEHLPFVRKRLIGIVSPRRVAARQVDDRTTTSRTRCTTCLDDICDIMREYDVTLLARRRPASRRPGRRHRRSPARASCETLGELTERAWRKGVQVMVEGPGHVPFDQIEYNMKLQRKLCHGAPFYVLGPLVTDIFPGYDHITSCIGATAAGVSRREHALLRHAEGAPRPAEEGRRQAGLRRLQDRRPRRRRRPGHPRHARPRRRADQGPRRPQLAEALRPQLRPRPRPRLPRRRPGSRHRLLRHVRPRLVLASASARRSPSSISGKDEDVPTRKAGDDIARRQRPKASKSSSSAATSRPRRSTSSPTRARRRRATATTWRTPTRRSSCRLITSRPWGGGERDGVVRIVEEGRWKMADRGWQIEDVAFSHSPSSILNPQSSNFLPQRRAQYGCNRWFQRPQGLSVCTIRGTGDFSVDESISL